jgi:HlyD family secretion protein
VSLLCALPFIASLLVSCPSPDAVISGYVEGEYVSLAPIASARILEVSVRRGESVAAGQMVARLEDSDARLMLDEAQARLAESRAEAERARLDLSRTRELSRRNVAAEASLDAAKATLDVAEARVREAEAALAAARWQLEQRELKAQTPGVVDDVLRHPGDMAGPGSPILSLLPDGAVKIRLYVPQALLPRLSERTELSINCDGCPDGLKAVVSYIAKEPEFTPPVIYSVERRQKLIYLIEARPADASPYLRPGVIVDARIKP